MSGSEERSQDEAVVRRAVESAIRIGVIALVVFLVFQIVAPFLSPALWGLIIAVTVYPAFRWLQTRLGGRPKLAATTFTVAAFAVLIAPTIWLTGSLVEWSRFVAAEVSDGVVEVPPPPESVAGWPVIGEPLDRVWSLASTNLQEALAQAKPQLVATGEWLLKSAAAAGMGVLLFALSILIAGFLLANAETGARTIRRIFNRLAPRRGEEFAVLAEKTVRSVATGVIGVALIQSALAAIGFFAAGVPGAAFLALLCALLGIVQLPLGIVLVPAIVWVWMTGTTLTAILFTVWSVPVMLVDNVLKPLLLGRGVEAPMLVIFLGAIGGFLASGIIGLFVGAVVLVLAYDLFRAWLEEPGESSPVVAAPSEDS